MPTSKRIQGGVGGRRATGLTPRVAKARPKAAPKSGRKRPRNPSRNRTKRA